jgi:hypothetical protein
MKIFCFIDSANLSEATPISALVNTPKLIGIYSHSYAELQKTIGKTSI